jgi:hypothetical protein
MSALCGLDRAAALCLAAEGLYVLVDTVYGLTRPPWATLSFAERHSYYLEVEALVARLKPFPNGATLFDQVVASARSEAARVIGNISPATPWGDPTPLPGDVRD